MSAVDLLLAKLDGVRRTGPGRWIARCPAHDDRSPSLSIRELDDGRVLIHCFAECETVEVLGAVGLDVSNLFPPRNEDGYPPVRRPFVGDDMLRALAHNALLIAVAGEDVAAGRGLSDSDRAALIEAASRLRAGVEACAGRNQ
ncbi:MAG: DNA primase [Nitrospirae bacterium]|nr:DNA primase [Nitrospirota bacterium]